jgi:hypothetical protein
MADTDDVSRWSWIAPDGKVGTGSTRELASALSAGGLPAATFVWKKTWLEWVPANRVAELASAMPAGKAEAPRDPRRAATALTPPFRPPAAPAAPPAVELPRPPQAPKRSPASEAADGRPSSFGVIGKARGPSLLGPPVETTTATRAPLPTLGEEAADTKATLRPPGAVPPPPRMVQAPARVSEEQQPTPRKIPALGVQGSPRDTISDSDLSEAPSLLLPSEIRTAVVLPGKPSSVSIHAETPKAPAVPNFDATLGSTPFEAPPAFPIEVEPAAPAESANAEELATLAPPGPAVATAHSSRAPVPRAMLLGIVGLAAVVALLAAGMVALMLRRGREAPVAAPSSSAVAPVANGPARTTPSACHLLEPAARLTGSVHRAVPPILAELRRGERVAIGLAEAPKDALGLVVNLATLDVERAFEQAGDKPVFGVVPLVNNGRLAFTPDRADGSLAGARTIGQGLTIGIAGTDLVRTGAGPTRVLWAGAAAEKITDPRVASSAAGHLVTFRRGGLSGRVLYGWLEPDGTPHGELGTLEVPNVTFSGTPDAALRGDAGLVVFAGRPSSDAEWRVQLASVPKKGRPSVRGFETPPGGPGGGSIAPSASALGSDGWLLQWTEGTSGKYQVREQRLTSGLDRAGEPWLVSPKGANAGQGALLVSGSRVLSVFVQTTAGHDELWGASFECR